MVYDAIIIILIRKNKRTNTLCSKMCKPKQKSVSLKLRYLSFQHIYDMDWPHKNKIEKRKRYSNLTNVCPRFVDILFFIRFL